MAAPADQLPLDLVIRFSTSNPDVTIHIDNACTTTALTLKRLIRSHLDAPAATSRLRLIHAGKVLLDTESLARSLQGAIHTPPRNEHDDGARSEKAKGKLPVRDALPGTEKRAVARVYIHCSIGDVLTSAQLAAEVRSAEEADAALLNDQPNALSTSPTTKTTSTATQQDGSTTTTTPAPRGFDRLLTAGFSPAEVATLRTQFLAIQAHTHTPDTMPTGPALLTLEERWLDNTPSSGNAGGGAGEGGGEGEDDAGGLDDMLWGNLMGFFWPVGAVCWLMREEGVWTRRRQIAVLSGFLVNLTFGFLRVMN